MAIENQREFKGLLIAARGSEVKRLNPYTYRVRSQSNPEKWYLVVKDDYNEWSCECPDYTYRRVTCKHIHAVNFSLRLRQKAAEESSNIGGVKLDSEPLCPKCGNTKIVKDGKRRRKSGEAQRYLCKACGYRFETVNLRLSMTLSTSLLFLSCMLGSMC